MADDEFNIDELISGNDESGEDVVQPDTCNTNNTSNSQNTANTTHPFSVRLDEEYVGLIKALAWWKRISQREFIKNAIDLTLNEMNDEQIQKIISEYRDQ